MKFSSRILIAFSATFALCSSGAFADTFEIIDGSASVAGKPNNSQAQARDNWESACSQWKSETKDLNRNDQLMMISCDVPVCSFDNGLYACTSNATFKVKTAGTLAQPTAQPPAPVMMAASPPPVVEQTIVDTAPPQIIVETVPVARPGFIWITGYWGWRNNRHYWMGGHWETHRPGYVYMSPHWYHYGHSYRLEPGHWRR